MTGAVPLSSLCFFLLLTESMPKAYIRIIITPLNLYKRLFWPDHILIILEDNEVKVCISHAEQGTTARQK